MRNTLLMVCNELTEIMHVTLKDFSVKYSSGEQALALWSANIYFTCCNMHNNSECYFLIGFITLEDLLTIIFCVLIKRLKKTVVTVLLSMSTAFLITGVVLFFVDRNNHLLSELAGGFWNTSVAILALLYASFLK
uniref:Uncharacterized protein n=1 Tax=Trichobilharzia regenti TaxID=157069 RepID=A0AA85J414_TRIRE|nr:unnamed protein product [Trichobilharzia regenti]